MRKSFFAILVSTVVITSPVCFRAKETPVPGANQIELFSDVILRQDMPGTDLRAGDVGTVVERHVVADLEDGYSVEFFDMTGTTIAVHTVRESQLRLPTHRDRPAARAVAAG